MPKLPQGRNLLFSVMAQLWQDAYLGPLHLRKAARATHKDILTYYNAASAMLPNLATRHSAATWEAQQADAAARQLTADRRLFCCLVFGAAYLLLLAGTLAAKYHWLPEPAPVEVAADVHAFV